MTSFSNIDGNSAPSINSSAIITVVRDPNHSLGKRFNVNPDGSISKTSNVSLSFGIAVQHHVSTHAEFATLLNTIGNDPHAAIINASFNGIEIGEEFVILSSGEIEKLLGISTDNREQQKGVHSVDYNGKTCKAVGRFKGNVLPSNWQLLDRDVDSSTPEKYIGLNTEAWLAALASIITGVDKVSYVETPSSSSRVIYNGNPVGQGNGHIWIYVEKPDDVERFRSALIPRAADVEMVWAKPRYSRLEADKVVGNSLMTIVDPSVFTLGRLVFDGQPTVSSEFTVLPLNAVVIPRENDALDTTTATLPDLKTIQEKTRKAGVEISVRMGNNGLKFTANDLTLDSEIETKLFGIKTIRELIKRGTTEKIRCQTPFRASESWAAFYSVNPDGIPFVYDNGTSTTHWLNEFEAEEVKLIPPMEVIAQVMTKVKEDAAAILEDAPINALAAIKEIKPAQYQRTRNILKQANNGVSLTAIDRSVKARIDEMHVVETHHGYAKSILAELTEEAWRPVGYQGNLYVLTPEGLWKALPVEALIRLVAEMHDNKENCSRSGDYRAIAEHAISLASDDRFFVDAPNGLACQGGFYQIVDNEITLVPLTPDHRQRVMLDFTPTEMPTPLFDKFLHETFDSSNEGEEAQQITLLQEIVGAIMLGILYKFQVAVLFYEAFGRAGKGTMERQIRCLVPKEFVSAISPFKWNQDYHVATLAGKRLNVVGELPESEPIPASAFKSVIGGDLVTGRHPTHRPITFFNEAAHLFMSNHLITTKDQSEAFFARWKILEYPNSRLRSGLPLDENLAQRIIDNELPGIGYWALQGAARLLTNGKLSQSNAHDRLMAKWRRCTNTLEEFIHDACELVNEHPYLRSVFYQDYTSWCTANGRKPFSKGRVKELLEHNIGMGIRLVELNGHETFRGIKKKPPKKSSTAIQGYRSPKKARKKARKWKAVTPPLQASAPLSANDITSIPEDAF